ncbi:SusC/RagA family TonB-linked outer membrane protein [Cellulophaga baltica]|uniref:SusC/RagA family TonB-linked outer membrane protein n=1 Tax=Cellulophaga baltica TaxID=76594 RepID=UPI00249514A8|nr:SusC/RagA family TonB-linked outer membrane protein [Cellulophaga baltica]
MKSKLTWILTPLLALMMSFSFAQEKTITGTVTDESGLPLPGVSVLVVGTTKGSQTDFDGNYAIVASQGQQLRFSYVGQKTVEKLVGSSAVVNVQLLEDAQALEEVIVLGYSSKGVDEVTGSSVQVAGDKIAGVQLPSIEQALQGKVAGLQMSNASGTPGSAQDIRIRGVGSINASNQPLFVIDGVPIINDNFSGSDNASTFNPMSAFNSQDIETMTVLKDAGATAAYGARGSNGVIVITTKRGANNKKTVFNFTSNVGFQNEAYNEAAPLTGAQRLELLAESLVNSEGYARETAIQSGVNDGLVASNVLDYDGTDYKWDALLKNKDAMLKNYTLSASGGDESSSFYASLGYNKTEAVVVGANFERLNGILNYNKKMRDNVDFSSSINVSNTKQNPILEGGSFFANPFITRALINPFNNPFNEDGSYNTDLQYGSLPNVLYLLDNNITRNELTRALANTKIDWELVNDLVFSTRFSIDLALTDYKNYGNQVEGDSEDVGGSVVVSAEKNYNYVLQNSLNYKFKLGENHNFNTTALFEYQRNQNSYLVGSGENFPTAGLTNLDSAGSNIDAGSSFVDWYNVSYLGLLSYNFAGKYVVDATYRREGSSRFSEGLRYGDFGSVGVAWNLHREDFVNNNIFNELRLRGSYGVTGNNAIDENSYQALLSYSADYAGSGAAFASQFGNPVLTWEKGKTLDVGLDFGIYDNRLSGSFAYYNRTTSDLLQEVPLSLTSGFDNQQQNIGEIVNKGYELELNYNVIQSDNFLWSISGNIGTVDNEVTKLAIDGNGEEIDPSAGSVYTTTQVGIPVRSWYMRTWAGVNETTGDPEWYLNGVDGEVTSDYNAAERIVQGSAVPDYTAGLSTHLEYKGIFMDLDFYAAGGHQVYEQFAQFYLRTNSFTLGSFNGDQRLLDRWQEPGDVTDVPRLSYNENNNFHATSSRHLYDGDFIRLRNAAIGYNVPSRFLNKIAFIDGLSFTLRGTNLATWVKDDGLKLDPEVRADGFTRLTTPPTKSYTFGVNVKF